MKKISVALAIISIIVSCSKKEKEGYTISGNLSGFENEEMVYINKVSNSNRPTVIDSIPMKDGKFEIVLPTPTDRDFNFLTFSKTRGNILVIAENNRLEITANKSDLRGAKVVGGEENQIFSEFLKNIQEQQLVQGQINLKARTAKQAGDYQGLKDVKTRQDSLTSVIKDLRLKVLNENPNTVAGIMALTDLINMRLLKGTEAKSFFEKMPADLKNSRLGRNAEVAISSVAEATVNIGDKVADFTAPTPSGEKLNLKKSLGKITILDFWASWCKPCRIENPNVVRVYNKYKSKGLEIIGISFDQKAERWKQAIDADGLVWKHVSNLKGWQEPLGKPFGVRSIPTTYLLDDKGVIIAKNLRGQALEDKIAELLD